MGILKRPFAATYDRLMARGERAWLSEARRDLLADLQGHVLELGAGTGADFEHYPPGVTLVATEPSVHMLKRARSKAASARATIELREADAQALPFEDDTFDAVVATLVFCTIPDPHRALAEVRRVASAGAPLQLIEHVHAETPVKRLILDAWSPAQQLIGQGCHPNRETVQAVVAAGFAVEDVRELAVEFGLVRTLMVRARAPEG
jgi:ubiquinone/menaquinone biosynthesis C-methylase UbiE